MQSSETEDQSPATLRQDGHDTDSCAEGGHGTGPIEKKKIPPDDIIIAIHGMGDQVRCGMVHTVADHLCRYLDIHTRYSLGTLHGAIFEPKVTLSDPFHSYEFKNPPAHPFKLSDLELNPKAVQERKQSTLVHYWEFESKSDGDASKPRRVSIGLSEIYWADIVRETAEERYTLDESKRWISQLAKRLILEKEKSAANGSNAKKKPPRFDAAGVLLQMVDGVRTLEGLAKVVGFAFGKHVNLSKILTDYLGDVQQVTEFESIRDKILASFCLQMQKIHEVYPNAKIHLLAHSEGTVVTFLALLKEIQSPSKPIGKKVETTWLKKAVTFITLGSPLDKHLHMWGELFPKIVLPKDTNSSKPEHPIKWYNYYDLGDPVGFDLDDMRGYINEQSDDRLDAGETSTNELKPDPKLNNYLRFIPKNDVAFSRYLFPGQAHIDYFNDEELFDHLFQDVIELPRGERAQTETGSFRKLIDNAYDRVAMLPIFKTQFGEYLHCHTGQPSANATFKQPAFGKKWGILPVWLVSQLIPHLASFGLLLGGVYLFYRAVDSYLPLAETAWDTARNVFAITIFLWCTTVAIGIARMVGVVEHLRITGDGPKDPSPSKAKRDSGKVSANSSPAKKALCTCRDTLFPDWEAWRLYLVAYATLAGGLMAGYLSITEAGWDRLVLSLPMIRPPFTGWLEDPPWYWIFVLMLSEFAVLALFSHWSYTRKNFRRWTSTIVVLIAMVVLLLNRGVENSSYNQFLESRPHPSNPEFDRDALKKIVAGLPLVTVVAKEVEKDTPKEVEENPKGETSPARQTSVTPAPKPPVAPPEVWLLVLGTGALLYLWWLVVILINLTLIWHAEIRWGQVDKKNWACGGHDKHGNPLKGSP